MAIDPNIALGVRGIELPNQLAQYGQVAQIQAAQQAQQMNALKMQEAQSTMEERNALRQLNPNSPDYEQQLFRLNPQLGIAFRKDTSAAAASRAQQTAHEATTAKTKQEMMGQALRDISSRPSDANITAHTEDILASPLFSEVEKQKASATQQTLLAMPLAERGAYLASQGAKPSELKPTVHVGPSGAFSTPAFSNVATPIAGSEGAFQMTPYQKEQLPIQRQSANAATLNANTAVARETRLAQGPVGTSLSPEQNDALFGENGAVALGKINPNRINSRNAKMWADAFTRNPNADPVKVAQDVATADKAIKDFGTGPQGVKVTSFNTAIDHLDTLAKLGAAMQNGDVKAFNTISNTLGIQSGQPMATMFNQASRIVGGEISKAIVPGVGTKAEREESANAFNSAMSPEQLKGADAVAKKLLGGQLSSLEQQYKRTTKRSDFAEQLLSPAARAAYQTSRPAEAVAAPTAGVNVVVTPDGQSHTFPTATAAAQFKKAAGL